jgi:hypothetical protein
MNSIFEPRAGIRVKDLTEVNIEALLAETYTITPIHCEKKLPDGSTSPNETVSHCSLPQSHYTF